MSKAVASSAERPPVVRRYLTVVTALLSMVGPFTIDTYLPSFPAIEADFGVDRVMLSHSLSVYLAAFAVSTLFWGPLADRLGRRRVILASLSTYTLAAIGCAMATQMTSFLWFRTVQGLAASGGFIAGRAMIRDAHEPQAAHRAMSQVTLLFAVAPAIAPVLGGWLHDQLGWRSVFWFLTGFGILLIGLVACIEETLAPAQRQSLQPSAVLQVYARTLRQRRFLGLVLCLALAFAGLFLYIAGAPTVIYDFLGLGSEDFGVQFIPMVGGMMLGAFLSSRLAHRWPVQHTVLGGLGLVTLAVLLNLLLALLFEPGILTVIGPLVMYAFGLAVAMPAITLLALDCFPRHRGTAASMQGFLQMLINAGVASVAVPLLHTQWLHFVLGQLAFLLLALLSWSSIRQDKPPGGAFD